MLSNKLTLVAFLIAISFIDCHAQFSKKLADGARTTGAQYIYNLNQHISPIEYPVEGTPYFSDDYSKSQVYSQNGNFFDIEMRYNIFDNRMEFKEENSLYALDPNLIIEKIVLGTHTFVVDNYEFKGETIPTFYLRLDSGKVTLLTQLRVVFVDRQQGKPIEGDIPAKYKRMPDTNYLKLDNGPVIKVGNVKNIIDELPDRKQEMEKFAKAEKISVNKPEELTKFIQHYNSLK